jgi:DNA-binding NarL/FixJ family response regulator
MWAEEWVMQEQDFYEEDSVQEDQAGKNPVRARMRELESEVKVLRQQADEAKGAQRELAFVKAGVDLSSNMSKYFVKGYDGELTPEAIRAAATEANLIQNQAPQQVVPQQEKQAWDRVGGASRMGDSTDAVVDYVSKMANTKSEKEVMELLTQIRMNQTNN